MLFAYLHSEREIAEDEERERAFKENLFLHQPELYIERYVEKDEEEEIKDIVPRNEDDMKLMIENLKKFDQEIGASILTDPKPAPEPVEEQTPDMDQIFELVPEDED